MMNEEIQALMQAIVEVTESHPVSGLVSIRVQPLVTNEEAVPGDAAARRTDDALGELRAVAAAAGCANGWCWSPGLGLHCCP